MAAQKPLQPTKAANSSQNFSENLGISADFNDPGQPPTIQSPMDSLSDSAADLRLLSCAAAISGPTRLPLSFLELGQHSKKTYKLQTQSSSTTRVPGEFFVSDPSGQPEHQLLIRELQEVMNTLRPVPGTNHRDDRTFIHKTLRDSTHVFIRQDPLRGALKPPYTGPYRVLSRNAKTFDVDRRGQTIKVSTDRVKQAFISQESTPPPNRAPSPVHRPQPRHRPKRSHMQEEEYKPENFQITKFIRSW